MIYLLWCTCRPDKFKKVFPIWKERANNPNEIELRICVDTVEQAQQLLEYPFVRISGAKKRGVCWPAYCLTHDLTPKNNDIIVFASDDFVPPQKWDTFISEQLKDDNGVLVVQDGYQQPNAEVLTIPIMNGGAFNKINIIIYTSVNIHLGGDDEVYFVA